MKKAYSKPEIFFEDFTLTTNIAGTCEHKTDNPSMWQCSVNASGINVFLPDITGCEFVVGAAGGDGEFNSICYHVPYGENLFNS